MKYEIEIKPRALKDLHALPSDEMRRISARIDRMANDLEGDVKQLRNFTPSYRMRYGDYRVLFEVDGNRVVIYRVRHRRDAYR